MKNLIPYYFIQLLNIIHQFYQIKFWIYLFNKFFYFSPALSFESSPYDFYALSTTLYILFNSFKSYPIVEMDILHKNS